MRVVSLLASATELVAALGEGASLVARSHECDSPPWVRRLPCLSRPTFDVSGDSAAIDARVREKLKSGEPLYAVDRAALEALRPDLVITQTHCDVCAVSPAAIGLAADPADTAHENAAIENTAAADAAHVWPGLEGMRTISMRAGSLNGILADFERVADALGQSARGQALTAALRGQMEDWGRATHDLPRPRVVCLEWTEPPFAMGNWGPELVALAGGDCVLGVAGRHSTATDWSAVVRADPDVLIVAPCGYGLPRAEADLAALTNRADWAHLRAVREGRVYVADGNRYFNRSGPAVFDTISLLAEMIHPDVFGSTFADTLYRRVQSLGSTARREAQRFVNGGRA